MIAGTCPVRFLAPGDLGQRCIRWPLKAAGQPCRWWARRARWTAPPLA